MKLVQPAAYQREGDKMPWMKLQDLLDIAKREFGMQPDEVWDGLCEWQKPYGGLPWTTEEEVMNSEIQGKPEDLGLVYIPERNARHFHQMAQSGVRAPRFNAGQQGHDIQWAKS